MVIIIERFSYFFRRGIKDAAARKATSAASVSIVAAALIMLGLFIAVGMNISASLDKLGDSREINVYIARDAGGRAIEDIKSELEAIDGVKDVRFYSREDRLSKVARKVYGDDDYSFAGGENPLRDSYILTVSDALLAEDICAAAEAIEGVEETVKSSDILMGINVLINGMKSIGLWLLIIMLLISMFIIKNAVKLGIESRCDEIEIMRTIGATNGFIVAPFIIQAAFLGLVGGVIASIVCVGGYILTVNRVMSVLPQGIIEFVSLSDVALVVLPVLLIIGIVIGIFGSVTAVRRYLKK